jgi:hypothetical protein
MWSRRHWHAPASTGTERDHARPRPQRISSTTSAHSDFTDARCIGVPLPGTSVKLVPADGAYEIRAKGPMVRLADPDDLNAAWSSSVGSPRTSSKPGSSL